MMRNFEKPNLNPEEESDEDEKKEGSSEDLPAEFFDDSLLKKDPSIREHFPGSRLSDPLEKLDSLRKQEGNDSPFGLPSKEMDPSDLKKFSESKSPPGSEDVSEEPEVIPEENVEILDEPDQTEERRLKSEEEKIEEKSNLPSSEEARESQSSKEETMEDLIGGGYQKEKVMIGGEEKNLVYSEKEGHMFISHIQGFREQQEAENLIVEKIRELEGVSFEEANIKYDTASMEMEAEF